MTPEERYPHLTDEAAVMADQDDGHRIAYISRDRFISHQQAENILDDLEALYKVEDAVRPQGRLVVGRSLMGKSTLFDEFLRRHPANDNPDGEAAIIPIVSVQYPDTAKEGIYPEILASLNARIPTNTKAPELRRATVELLRQVGMRVLLIDEIHNLMEGSANSQRKGLNSIKYIMNQLHRPVITAGTIEALNAIRTDEQIRSRLTPLPLKRFRDDDAFQELLQCFELVLPLRKPSYLSDPELSSVIYQHTFGIVGRVAEVLNKAAVYAIREGIECITAEMIEEHRWGILDYKELTEQLL